MPKTSLPLCQPSLTSSSSLSAKVLATASIGKSWPKSCSLPFHPVLRGGQSACRPCTAHCSRHSAAASVSPHPDPSPPKPHSNPSKTKKSCHSHPPIPHFHPVTPSVSTFHFQPHWDLKSLGTPSRHSVCSTPQILGKMYIWLFLQLGSRRGIPCIHVSPVSLETFSGMKEEPGSGRSGGLKKEERKKTKGHVRRVGKKE